MYTIIGSDGRQYGPVDSATLQTWKVGHPELIQAARLQLARQVRINPQFVVRVGGAHKRSLPQTQQIVSAHQPQHSFVIYHPTASL